MADRQDIDFTYSLTDRVFRLSLGELADFSGAKYDGDFSLTLEQAQRRKHDYVAEQIGIEPGPRVVDIDAPRDSDAWYLALMGRQFPGSWLPLDREQIVRCAEPGFRLVASSNGRLDYIQTITEWGKRTGARSLRKSLLKLALVPRWLSSRDFRLAFTSGVSANKVCFERELIDHHRLVFEKTS